MISELILNVTLLITLTVLFSFISRQKKSGLIVYQLMTGFLFGIIAVIGMSVPFRVSPGIIYDGRSIVLSMAGLFGGCFSGAVSLLMALVYRIYIGGDGVWAGTATIFSSVVIGLLFRWFLKSKPEKISVPNLYLFGLITHMAMLGCQLLLPQAYALEIIRNIWLPVILIFPMASLLMGLIFRNELKRINAENEIQENEFRYKTTLLSIGDGVITTDNRGMITFINPMAVQLTGWKEQEAIGRHVEDVFTIVSEENEEKIINPVDKILKEGLTKEMANHTLLITRIGERVPISDSGAPVKDANGKITGVVLIFKDQTDERNLRNQLIESENLFHNLTEQSPMGIFRTRSDGYTTYVNPRWCEISGIASHEALGDGWLQGVHPEDKHSLAEGWKQATNQQQRSTIEYRFIRPNGQQIWVLGVAVPELSPEGKPRGYIGTVIDITKRKLAEKELIQSHENFRRTMDESPLGMRIVTNNGQTSYVNSEFLALYGYTNEEEFNQTPVSSRYTEASLKQHIIRKKQRLKGIPVNPEYEIEIFNKNGAIRNLSVLRKMIFWNGHLQNLVIYRDFTERKQAENRLQLLGRAIDQNPVSIVITDAEGHITYVNPKFSDVSGYSYDEVMGKNPSFLKSGYHQRKFYADLWSTILEGKEWHGEFLNKRKNGELYWESAVISSIIDNKGKITHFVEAKEDITEKKKIIADLQLAKEKAEESDRLKSAFLANMSHEIRTPLNAIMGFTHLLIEDEELDQGTKSEFFSILNQSAENLLQVINDILDLSKIETGQLQMHYSSFDVCADIQELYLMSNQQLLKWKKSHLDLNYEIPTSPIMIYADKVRVNQVFSNLLNNAIKFTNQGKICFGIQSITSRYISFFVSDTGIGISYDKQQDIFERFRQADDSSTRVYGGAGLGLSISKKLIEQMGGEISLKSEEGKGTTFTFTIPQSKKPGELQS